jgi:CHAT domain-containing protein
MKPGPLHRALVLDEMAERHRVGPDGSDPTIALLDSTLGATRARLANLVVRSIGTLKPETYRRLVEEASQEKEAAERALAARSSPFRREQARAKIGFAEVASALPKGSALVGYFSYTQFPLPTGSVSPAGADNTADRTVLRQAPTPSYLAFVLRFGERGPEVVPLGGAASIDSLVLRWRDGVLPWGAWRPLHGTPRAIGGLSSDGESTKEEAFRRVGTDLRKRVWDPIAAHLRGVNRVFVVPDGALNLLSFAALPAGDAGYLIERGLLIHYLSAERDIAAGGVPSRQGEGLMVLGGANFEHIPRSPSPAATRGKRSRAPAAETLPTATFRGPRSDCEAFATMMFASLPGTNVEAERVADVWKRRSGSLDVLKLRGEGAGEAAFKHLVPGRRVLHLATHGFFLDERCVEGLPRARSSLGEAAPVAVENPLLRAGLVLAGANRRHLAKPGEEDGILTAEEVASLDLTASEWVVLSACDTGLGRVAMGEGVLGLRRAFQIAGARTVIMSLWKVDDQATMQWMQRLYQARWGRGMETAEAVRAASLQMLEQYRKRGQSTHPSKWAGFIAAGDWR